MSNTNLEYLIELSGNKARARAAGKQLSLNQIEKLVEGLNSAYKVLKEEAEEKETQEKLKIEKAAKVIAMMQEAGLSLDDLQVAQPLKRANKGATVEPKYRLTVDGETHEWTGRGRTPKVFQEYFEAGNSRDSVTI